jgi:hypothetical protein
MTWRDLSPTRNRPRRFFREDWSREEQEFRDSIPSFLSAIAVANDGGEAGQARSNTLSDGFDFDDEPAKEPESKSEPAPEPAPAEDDDPFSFDEPAEAEPAKAEPEPAEPVKGAEPDPFDKPDDSFPPSENPLSEGFDQKTFDSLIMPFVSATAERVSLPEIESARERLAGYGLHLDLDKHRENPDLIADLMTKVQAMKDSVMTEIVGLGQLLGLVKRAWDYIMAQGMSCSGGSNRDKRMAQVMYAGRDLYEKMTQVEVIYEAYDKTYRHLCGQTDMLSRLLTVHLERARGALATRPRKIKPEDDTFSAPAERVAEPVATSSEPTQADDEFSDLESFDADKAPPEGDNKYDGTGLTDF